MLSVDKTQGHSGPDHGDEAIASWFKAPYQSVATRREANDKRIAEMLEQNPNLNELELEMHDSHLRALEKQVYRDLQKEGDIDHETMESLVRDVVERKSKKDA